MSKKNIKIPEPTSPVKLDNAQMMKIVAAEKHVTDLKCKLANLAIQQLQVAQDAVRAEKAMLELISEAARIHGIHAGNARKWNFDIKEMTFTQIP